MRVLLILVDGLRPDAIKDNPKVMHIMDKSAFTMEGTTVMPSATLPCHMSLFHSVDPQRHGNTTNIYTPQVKPVRSLCNVLNNAGKKSAFFYNWEQLRDMAIPGMLSYSVCCRGDDVGWDKSNDIVTDEAIRYITSYHTDFTFLYLGATDISGHRHGWLSDEYMASVDNSLANIERIMSVLPEDYVVFITADHGGHDKTHGTDMKEDMTIPLIIKGNGIEEGKIINNMNIKDIAPTITTLLGVAPDKDWDGKNLL